LNSWICTTSHTRNIRTTFRWPLVQGKLRMRRRRQHHREWRERKACFGAGHYARRRNAAVPTYLKFRCSKSTQKSNGGMMNLISKPNGEVALPRLTNWPGAGSLTSRNSCQVVGSIVGVQSAHDVGSVAGSATKKISVSTRANVHQNVHQRIEEDRIGYVQISLDFCCTHLPISLLHSDSNSTLRILADTIGYWWIISDLQLLAVGLIRPLRGVFSNGVASA